MKNYQIWYIRNIGKLAVAKLYFYQQIQLVLRHYINQKYQQTFISLKILNYWKGDIMTYEFSQYSKKIIYNNKVVLGNTKTGQWIRISQEVFNILDSSIENKISLEELKLNLYDDEDKNYIENLYKKLIFMGILDDGKNKPEFTNKIASVEMTHKCNLNCIHCGIDADSMKNSTKEDLTTSELKDILDKLILWNPERIMLSGGSLWLEMIS